MTAKEIIAEFDKTEGKKFNETILNSALRKLHPNSDSPISFDLLAELMAFNFVEDYQNKKTNWGTYFGPMMVYIEENGTGYEIPSIKSITPEIINYWNIRAKESINPIIIARYSGLVYDFSNKICGQKPDYKTTNIYIKSLIEVANGDYSITPYETFKKLKRALDLAISQNNNTLIEKVKRAIIDYEDLKNDESKFWGYSFDLLINNRKINLTTNETNKIINDLKNKFDINTSINDKCFNISASEKAFNRLILYYYKTQDNYELNIIINKMINIYEIAIQREKHPMSAEHILEKMYSIYIQFNYKTEAEAILIRIRRLGNQIFKNYKKITFEFNLKKQILDKFIEEMLTGNDSDILIRLAVFYIPKKELIKTDLENNFKKHPLLYLVSNHVTDSKGRKTASIGSYEDDYDSHFMRHLSKSMQFQSIFLNPLLIEAFNKNKINKDKILTFLNKVPIIDKTQFHIIKKALDSYFKKDFLVFLHLIIPQIENTIRNFLEFNGGTVLKQKNKAYQLKTFEELLRDNIIKKYYSEDFSIYFRALYTDHRSWNLRNNICHGITEKYFFTETTANRVLHSLICLGLIREVDAY